MLFRAPQANRNDKGGFHTTSTSSTGSPRISPLSRSPRDHRAHAGRRSGHDDVAGCQRTAARQFGDQLGHAPDHVGKVAALPRRAVDQQRQGAGVRPTEGRGRHQRAHRCGSVEALADLPGPARRLGLALEVAPRHVQAGGVAPDVGERFAYGDVAPAGMQRHAELQLVLVVRGEGRIGDAPDRAGRHGHDRVGRLHEEERRLAFGVAAHLAGVVGVVAADAVDPAHGEQGAVDRGKRRGCEREKQGHAGGLAGAYNPCHSRAP